MNKRIINDWKSDCETAEKMRSRKRGKHLPQIQELDSLVVFSMDVVALYPNILAEMAKVAVAEAIERTEMDWENIDVVNLQRYVAMTLSKEEIKDKGLQDIIPDPKGTTTFHSFVNPRKTAAQTGGDSQFREATRIPNEKEVKVLIGEMI